MNTDQQSKLNRLDSKRLPVLPPGVPYLLKNLTDESMDFHQLSLTIERFPTIAARLIALAKENPDTVFCVSVGNEASVEWTDHMVPVENLVEYVREVKKSIKQPVTFCENYVPWTYKLEPLAEELDFIAVHTYPAWEYRSIHDALEFTKQNYHSVVDHYPGKPVIITEAGWTTAANGRGIDPHNASEELQASYYQQLLDWTTEEKILTFVFEAFDEPWKGSPDPLEPEKHWGLFRLDRTPKPAVQAQYAEMMP